MKSIDLLQYILPEEIFKYFEVTNVQEQGGRLIIHLDEKNQLPIDFPSGDYESKGFTKAVELADFPIRDRAVFLLVRRRKWLNKKTGKVHSRSWDLTAQGTKYTKEFGAFLKELARR
jgi:hypothetical protein